ncbi:MAG: YlqD family protein [bacterium]
MDMEKSIKVKRPVTIKTVVTDLFKKQATEEINKEMHLLESQIMQLELQNKQIQDQAANYTSIYGDENSRQIQQALTEIANRLQQMAVLKQELYAQRENINHLAFDNIVITGSLENYVQLKIGENIYEKFKEAEILVKDGIIQEINC